jgi:hypothetical protein
MRSIFISYRREDSAGQAGRLYDHLHQRTDIGKVFMDVVTIEPGVDFEESIESEVGRCDILIAVIGKSWIDSKDESGKRRLDDPKDFIRLETAAALRRKIRVIPVLVQGARMPRADELPEDLQSLARRQAVEVRDTRWNADVGDLIERIVQAIRDLDAEEGRRPTPPSPPERIGKSSSWQLPVLAGLIIVAIAVTWWATHKKNDKQDASGKDSIRSGSETVTSRDVVVPSKPRASQLAVGASASGHITAQVVVRDDGRIDYDWWELGQGGHGPTQIDGMQSNTAPSAALVGSNHNYLFVVVKGNGDTLYLNQGELGKGFVGWQPLRFQSKLAPGATSSGNTSALVAVREDGGVFYDWWKLGEGARGFVEIAGMRSDATPAAALVGPSNSYLFVIVKGLDGSLYLNQGELGSAFVGWQPLRFQTKLAPCAASSGNTTAIVAVRPDGHIVYDSWELGQGGRGFVEIEGMQSEAAPACALVGSSHNYLFVIAKGLDGKLHLNQGELGKGFVGWQ